MHNWGAVDLLLMIVRYVKLQMTLDSACSLNSFVNLDISLFAPEKKYGMFQQHTAQLCWLLLFRCCLMRHASWHL